MNKFDSLAESILSQTEAYKSFQSRGNVPRADHDDKATMYGKPVKDMVPTKSDLDKKYGKPKRKLKGEAKEAPRGKHFKKGSKRLYKNGHTSDGNPEGGSRLNSDPTYKNPNESKVSETVDQLDEKKADRCKRKADSVYGKKTSAYKSGAIVRCRQGKIWKKK